MKRFPVNKQASAQTFRKHQRRTKAANYYVGPMRGGIRL